MSPFRPVRIFWQNGVTREAVCVATWAVRRILLLADILGRLQVEDGCRVELSQYVYNLYGCVWSGYLDTRRLLRDFLYEQQNDGGNYYSIILTASPLYYLDEIEKKEIYGLATENSIAIITTHVAFNERAMSSFELLRTIVFHEVAHMFGVPRKLRNDLIPSPINGGLHCGAMCVMYPRIMLVEHLMARRKVPFCPRCLCDLRAYFTE